MKKLLAILIFILLSIFIVESSTTFASCTYDWDIWWSLDSCLNDSNLVNWFDTEIDWWFLIQIKDWTNNISLYLWILAVWSIVFWSLMLTLSTWEEDKVKKAKDIIKWGIIWFIWLISITAIVNLIVKIMYSI